jgi:hypothetical protein
MCHRVGRGSQPCTPRWASTGAPPSFLTEKRRHLADGVQTGASGGRNRPVRQTWFDRMPRSGWDGSANRHARRPTGSKDAPPAGRGGSRMRSALSAPADHMWPTDQRRESRGVPTSCWPSQEKGILEPPPPRLCASLDRPGLSDARCGLARPAPGAPTRPVARASPLLRLAPRWRKVRRDLHPWGAQRDRGGPTATLGRDVAPT